MKVEGLIVDVTNLTEVLSLSTDNMPSFRGMSKEWDWGRESRPEMKTLHTACLCSQTILRPVDEAFEDPEDCGSHRYCVGGVLVLEGQSGQGLMGWAGRTFQVWRTTPVGQPRSRLYSIPYAIHGVELLR
jgi:hypothetical protein